jgi:RND family efflux transporter MFP subunit
VLTSEKLFRHRFAAGAAILISLWLSGCGRDTDDASSGTPARAVPIRTAIAETRTVVVEEQSLGRLEAQRIPDIAAETAGQIQDIRVDAGAAVAAGALLASIDDEAQRLAVESADATVARLQVLLDNQVRTVERLERLSKDRSVAESMVDDAVAQSRALRAQVAEASARARETRRALAKTQVTSPIEAVVQERHVSVGDFVAPGQPLFALVAADALRAYLPFPETLASRIVPGQSVELSLPTAEAAAITATVTELRPMVGSGTSAFEAIVDFSNPGGWKAGASVRGRVAVETRPGSIIVPETSVVQRPAGEVVYVVDGEVVHQQRVVTGVRQQGTVEIREGLAAGSTIASDGAGFLTDGARVRAQ